MHSSCVLLLLLARTAMARRRGAWRPAEPTKTRCAAARGSAVSILAGLKMLFHGRKEALAGCWCDAGGKRAVQVAQALDEPQFNKWQKLFAVQ